MNSLTKSSILKRSRKMASDISEYGTAKIRNKVLNMDNLNPRIVKMQYAVRGPLFLRSVEIEKELKQGIEKPFKQVIKANVGDCHAMGQAPITFIRNVLACVSYPDLMKTDKFPQDVKNKADKILNACAGKSIGFYSIDTGIEVIRQSVADYIEKRDGHKVDFDSVFLSPGASIGIRNCLQLLINEIDGKPTGVMVPIPQYPLYSATIAEYGLSQVDYYLDERKNWGLTEEELERSFQEGSRSSEVRALVVINPGNPTGQVLTRENIETIIKFAYKHSLMIFADEVYQHNIYEGEFFSFKKVLVELGPPYDQVQLASFMSTSKGYMGECGLRGGWVELVNVDQDVRRHLYKCMSARLCPTTLGQTVVECVARPPEEGDPSFEEFMRQKTDVLKSLKERAILIEDMFNKMDGFSCNRVQVCILS